MKKPWTWILCGLIASASFPLAATITQSTRASAIDRPILDAHNCYPDEGRWTDRLSRALGTNQARIGIEQDLVWRRDGAGGGVSVVGHSATLVGGEPTLEDYFFKAVAPRMEAALTAGNRAAWPLIVLHFDFKTNEPEHHRFVLSLLKKYERWLTTSVRGSDDRMQPMTMGPLLVLTEAGQDQQKDFYDTLPQGERLLIFGTVPPVRLTTSTDREVQADAAIGATPDVLMPTGATNYRRWANFSWAVVERGGQTRAGDWTPADASRLTSIVSRAHERGLWLRFYTLNGVAPGDDKGWSAGYNFGSLPAAQTRWRAAISAGVDLLATDQYESAAVEFTAARAR
jgi:hypothetical protein